MRMILVTLFLTLTISLHGPEYKSLYIQQPERIQPYERIWVATCQVESGRNHLAYNHKENAVGISQIRQVRLDDYFKRTGKRFKLSEMYDSAKSHEVWIYYATLHGYKEIEAISRCWNGGEENGMKYRQTKKYYLKVKQFINQ